MIYMTTCLGGYGTSLVDIGCIYGFYDSNGCNDTKYKCVRALWSAPRIMLRSD